MAQEALTAAGIDTTIFKVHSATGANTSAVSNLGFARYDILCAANWSLESSLEQLHYKPVHNYAFAMTVLSGTATNHTIYTRDRDFQNTITE